MLREIAIAPFRGLVLAGLSVLGLVALMAHAAVLILTSSFGLIILVPWAVGQARKVTGVRRTLAARWDRVRIAQPYAPPPAPPLPDVEGFYVSEGQLYKTPRMPMLYARIDWMLDDRATWRDIGWLLLNATLGNVLALTPAALIVYGTLTMPWGVPLIALGFLSAPVLLRLHTTGSRALLGPARRGFRSRPSTWFPIWGRCSALAALSLLSLVALVAPRAWRVANQRRKLAGDWSGVPVAKPYANRTTKRDRLFFALDPFVGLLITAVPMELVVYGGWGLALPQTWRWFTGPDEPDWAAGWYGQFAGSDALAIPVGLAMVVAGLWLSPPLARLNGLWVRLMLAPSQEEALVQRVRELTHTRAEATDAAEAELRRIERDLHDGAQARLVAMGLGLGALERLIDHDPAKARQLLAKVRDNSAKALAELRDLVRGIHPPVLADRGLGDAVRALALDTPLPVKVHVDLSRKLDPPVESAAYFAISEVLSNVTRHADADAARVDVCLGADTLELTVWDDGRGGADMSRGTGLRGVARRLSAFDGAMTVSSPVGGPTTVRMTLRVSAG
ncbi:Signal transduction histidine kinase [Kibdelosporangium sp. 4NS15]|uniref:histidine kinase n=1 Tax=Kibdelosporangium persicum TaxID=2698649 RepID=A0ABX2F2M0_9PSEU|nr:histidine kinase [Kibdelosporangium persicum]NRN65584.1 Signal transduction histidine kinase [Kibdelosporangium persicum]